LSRLSNCIQKSNSTCICEKFCGVGRNKIWLTTRLWCVPGGRKLQIENTSKDKWIIPEALAGLSMFRKSTAFLCMGFSVVHSPNYRKKKRDHSALMKSTPGSLLPRQSVPHDIINLSPPLGLRPSSTPLSFFHIQNEWSFLLPETGRTPEDDSRSSFLQNSQCLIM
jgi:hypothetical protein